MGTEGMDEQQYEEAGGQDDDFPVPVDVKRRAEANGEAIEEQVLPYKYGHHAVSRPVLEEIEWLPNLKTFQFHPLSIDHHEQVEAAHKMLKQRGQEAGGFNTDEPVPSLWYADIKALRDGMRARVKGYAEQYERWVLKPVRDIIDGHRQKYKRKHGRTPPFRQQYHVNEAYGMLFRGKPWAQIKPILADLLPEKHLEHIQRRVRPDGFNEEWGRTGRIQCRDGLLLEVHPPLLQWHAARLALSSIAMQVPISDLPSDDKSPLEEMPDYVVHNIEAIVAAYRKDARSVPTDVGTFQEAWIPKAGATRGYQQSEVEGISAHKTITRALRKQGYSVGNGDWKQSNPESLCKLLDRLFSEKYRAA